MPSVADYAFAHPTPQQIVLAGYTGVSRYVCPDNPATAPKILRADELAALHAAGLFVWLNFEWYESRPTEGAAAGHTDGLLFVNTARALGFPLGAVLPWSFDQAGTFADCAAYAQAIAGVIRPAGYRVGMYGGSVAGHALLDAGLVDVFWQSMSLSWSNYQVSTRAALIQRYGVVKVPGCDHNDQPAPAIGAWGPAGLDTGPTSQPLSGDEDMPYIIQDNGSISNTRDGGTPAAWAPWEAHIVFGNSSMHIANDQLLKRWSDAGVTKYVVHPDDYKAAVALLNNSLDLQADRTALKVPAAQFTVTDQQVTALAAAIGPRLPTGITADQVRQVLTDVIRNGVGA